MAEMVTLKSCPFCGNEPEAVGRSVFCRSTMHQTFGLAREEWNTRAPVQQSASPSGLVEDVIANIVRDVCELPGDDDVDADDTLVLSVDDLFVILGRNLAPLTAAPATAGEGEEELTEADHAKIDAAWQRHKRAGEGGCIVPPTGWLCTRAHGHDGPCAAVPATPSASREAIERIVSRAIHEHLSRRDIMQYLDNDEDCEGLARAVLAVLPIQSPPPNDAVREALSRHHEWHLAQDEAEDGTGGAEAYADSTLFDQTVRALSAQPAQAATLTAQVEALLAENFALAAGLCINPGEHGLVGDEGGTPICTAFHALKAEEIAHTNALAEGCAREAALRSAAEKLLQFEGHQIYCGHGDDMSKPCVCGYIAAQDLATQIKEPQP